MSATTLNRRRSKAFAEKQAAKERRQKYFVAAAVLVLVVVVAIELPGIMSHGGSSPATQTAAAPAPAVAAPVAPVHNPAALRAALRHPGHDPFVGTTRPGPGANTLGSVPNPPGLHDPFASRATPEATIAPAAPTPVARVAASGQDRHRHPRWRTSRPEGLDRDPRLDPDRQRASARQRLSPPRHMPRAWAAFPCSTRRTVGRCGAVTGSSTQARTAP